MKNFINAAYVRRFMLDYAKQTRPSNKFTRVSKQTIDTFNERVRSMIVNHVHSFPSKGKTL